MSQLHWTNRNVENVTVIWHCSSKTVNFSSTNRYPEVGSGVLLRCFSGLIHRTRLSLFKKLKLFCEIPLIFELFLSVIEVDLMNHSSRLDLAVERKSGPEIGISKLRDCLLLPMSGPSTDHY